MTDIIICGALGRMGRAILAVAESDGGIGGVRLVESKNHPDFSRPLAFRGKDLLLGAELPESGGAVVVDFSAPEAAAATLKAAAGHGMPVVMGTTGLGGDAEEALAAAAKRVAVVRAANMSTGVNVLLRLVSETARLLGDGADVEIVEAHHNRKKDAPSGTALALADAVKAVRGGRVVSGREGKPGERPKDEIGIHAVRAGDIAGDHTVLFGMGGERIELVHRAHGREAFARGALRAATFAASASPGLYSMGDVLGTGA